MKPDTFQSHQRLIMVLVGLLLAFLLLSGSWRHHMFQVIGLLLFATTTILWLAARLTRQMKSSHQELEKLVAERTRNLVETSHELAHNEQRLQSLLDISQYQATDVQGLLDFSLEQVIKITQSSFGYIYHFHEDRQEFVLNSWSKGVMPSCTIANPQSIYQLEKTGIWGEAVRQRKPILINDFAAENPLKKGYPEGHVHLSRFLTMPIFDTDQRIVAVVGVANKELPYTDQDMRQLSLMLAEVWRITKRLELEQLLQHNNRQWQSTFDAINDSVCLIDADQRVLRCNQASRELFNRDFDGIGHHCWEIVHGTDKPIDDCPLLRAKQSRTRETQIIRQGDRWLLVIVDPILNEAGQLASAVHIVHDDTERVRSEEALLQSQALIDSVMNSLETTIAVIDATGKVIRVNNEWSDFALQNNGTAELAKGVGLNYLDACCQSATDDADITELLTGIKAVQNRLIPSFSTEYPCHGPTEQRWFIVYATPLENSDGGVVLTHLNITSRKLAEQELAVERDRLENASSTGNIALWDWDITNGTLIWSSVVDRMLQMEPGTFSRTIDAWSSILHPDDRERVRLALTNHLEQNTPYELDYRVCAATGDYLDWHVIGQAYRDTSGKAIRMTGSCADVTERKLIERSLGDTLIQAQRFRTALDYVNAFIYIKDCESRYVYANRPCLELFNCTAEELPGSSDIRFFPPETVARLHAVDARVLNGERTTEEIAITLSDGEIRTYLELKTPIFADTTNELISGLLGISTDITTLKQSETALRELHAQLLQNEKLASIGQLSAGIAHEINNPMGFVNSNLGTLGKYIEKFDNYITLLEELVQKGSDPQLWQTAIAAKRNLKLDYVLRDVHQLIQESAEGAERVMKIVHDLKTFSRSDTSQTGNADINQNLDSTINIIWNQIKYFAELVRDYGVLPKVPCNIQQVNQVFMNLLVNAVHALQHEKLEELGTITVRTWADEGNAYVSVSDTGCGIPENILSRIFDPFFTTKEVGKGTGLGLSISHEIIKKHGGELSVKSNVGKGTTFTVRLPLIEM